MGTELVYQPLLGDSALLCIPKSALEDVYPMIRGRLSVTAEMFPYWEGTFLLFEGEKWRRGEKLGEMLIIIDNVLKAAKNMELFLHFQGVLDNKGHPIGRICLRRVEAGEVQRHEVIRGLVA
eukprot:g19949.t1